MIHDHDIWVCVDCYFAHHYGATSIEVAGELQWFAGESDNVCDREPLRLMRDDVELADNTCSNHFANQDVAERVCDHCRSGELDNGIHEFSSHQCQGCGSTLGGARYRLAVFTKEPA